MMKIININP